MSNIVTKCVAWNETRYDQILNIQLGLNLLVEETTELFEANNPIDVLDALGDITFVAIGVLWKAGVPVEAIENLLGITESGTYLNKLGVQSWYMAHLGVLQIALASADDEELDASFLALNAIYGIVIPRLMQSGMIADFYNIVDAICESNNTKVIKGKTDPSVKANIDKGATFVPPTAALQAILNKYVN